MLELVAVIALISLCTGFMLPTYLTESKYQQVSEAVARGQQIAAIVEFGRSMGAIGLFSGSLNEFVSDPQNKVDELMPRLKDNYDLFDVPAGSLYNIDVSKYGAVVSFELSGDEFTDYRFPSVRTQRIGATEDDPVKTVWTMGPSLVSDINLAYGINQYINEN